MLLNPVLLTNISQCSEDIRLLAEESVGIITEAINRYGVENIALAFNGGKDCTALLHLLHIALHKLNLQNAKVLTINIKIDEGFPEVNKFIEQSVELYKLKMVQMNGKIKPALFELKKEMPHISAVLMGTRSTDPYAATLRPFIPCDPGWPDLMRVNPILTWTYDQVWRFMRELKVPYCRLYDAGYTSLGNVRNTTPNPALLSENGETYRPAYCLTDGLQERAGRG